ncbi:alkanesulfonate transporter substrate-binding subunit [Escherichia coli]|uniref:Alkanesulfonate transporter substrate-binding subunit n=1 Tax=Escherichia coli TaxID=562 RepID=A0A376KYV8_ECOLX|nr:alkanesulfonate transporter substrate-binding subunit [Escherichia coli]
MRNIIKLALAGLLSVSTFAVAAESSPEALRIGYQKGSIGMVLAKSHQLLKNAIRNQKSPGWSSPRVRKCWKR